MIPTIEQIEFYMKQARSIINKTFGDANYANENPGLVGDVIKACIIKYSADTLAEALFETERKYKY